MNRTLDLQANWIWEIFFSSDMEANGTGCCRTVEVDGEIELSGSILPVKLHMLYKIVTMHDGLWY